MNRHIDQRARLRNLVNNAVAGASFESLEQDGGFLRLLHAVRPDGRRVHLRFLGVKESKTSANPQPGSPLSLRGIGGTARFWEVFLPFFLRTSSNAARVRIEAGAATLEIVCEDVEWWEDGA
jgi:hypothetical protein